MLNTANINTNTTARTGTARIDREAIANNLPTLAEVLARPVEYIRVATYRSDGNTPYLRRAEVREIAAPLHLECVQMEDDPLQWYRIHVVMPCGVAPCVYSMFCDYDAPQAGGASEWSESRFRILCAQVLKATPLTHAEYAQFMEAILTDPEMRCFIGKADILLMAEICKTDSSVDATLPARMVEYRARWQKRFDAQQAAAEAEERAEEEARRKTEQEARAAEKREIIRQLLQGGERIGAEYARKDAERDTFARLLVEIAQDCGVNIPVKVKGWMFKSLAGVNVKGGECESVLLWKNGGTHSTTIYKYINLLLQALASGGAEAEACGVAE